MPASLKLLSDANKVASAVFAKWPGDQRYYVATVLEIDEKTKQCKIKYEDEYQCWTDTKDLHLQLAIDELEDEHIICCVCDSGHSKAPNEIVICDVCQQSYHVKCHQPAIDREEDNLDDADAEWNCSTCKYLLTQDNQPLPTYPKSSSKTSNGGKVVKTPSKGRRKSSSSPKSLVSQSPKKTPAKRGKTDSKPKASVKKSTKKAAPSSQAKIKLTKGRKYLEKPSDEKQPDVGSSQDIAAPESLDLVETAETKPLANGADAGVDKMDVKPIPFSDGEARESAKADEKIDLAGNVANITLVEKTAIITTSEFVGLISPGESADKVTLKPKRVRKPSSKVTANIVPTAAAAY